MNRKSKQVKKLGVEPSAEGESFAGRIGIVLADSKPPALSRFPWLDGLIRSGWAVEFRKLSSRLGFGPADALIYCSRGRDVDLVGPVHRVCASQSLADRPLVLAVGRFDDRQAIAILQAGADDCFDDSVVPELLAARIERRIIGRHPRSTLIAVPDAAGVVVSSSRQTVEVGGRDVAATAVEFRISLELARQSGTIVSRQSLYERVHGRNGADDKAHRTLDSHICALRQKLGQSASGHLVTLRSLGYRLNNATVVD
jgi:DNA-binding response OmpR family regulator